MHTTHSQAAISWYPWYVVSLLSLAYLFSFVDRVIISLLIVPVQEDLNIGDVEVSLIIGMGFALFYTLFGLPIGRLVDVWNRRSIIIIGILTWSLATAACGLANGFWHLFSARVIVAVGEATLSPSAYSLIMDYFPPQRIAFAMSVYGMGVFVGAGAALMLGGYVIVAVSDQSRFSLPLLGELRSWQIVFIAVGLPGILMAALLMTVREPKRRGVARNIAAVQKAVPLREIWEFLRLNQLTFSSIIGAYALTSLFGYGLNAWAPTFLIRTYDWELSSVGLIYGAVVLVSGLLGIASGGLVADWMEKRGVVEAKLRTMMLGYGLMCPCAIAAPLMPASYPAVILMAMANFGFSFPAGSGAAALLSITPNQMRGQVSAVYLLVLNIIGLGLGPFSIALITDYGFGDRQALRYSISIVAAIVLPIALLFLAASRKSYRQSLARAKAWAV